MQGLKLALILVLFTFGGWNEMAYVAAEVKRPQRNIVRALVIGTIAVTVLYVLVNAAFLHALGYAKMAASEAVAVETIATVFPKIAGSSVRRPSAELDRFAAVFNAVYSEVIGSIAERNLGISVDDFELVLSAEVLELHIIRHTDRS